MLLDDMVCIGVEIISVVGDVSALRDETEKEIVISTLRDQFDLNHA